MLLSPEKEKKRSGLRLLSKLSKICGPSLVPFYRQLLPPLSRFQLRILIEIVPRTSRTIMARRKYNGHGDRGYFEGIRTNRWSHGLRKYKICSPSLRIMSPKVLNKEKKLLLNIKSLFFVQIDAPIRKIEHDEGDRKDYSESIPIGLATKDLSPGNDIDALCSAA